MSEEQKLPLADDQVWQNFKNGDMKTFDFLYDKFFPILYGYGVQLCSNKSLVKDAIQNLFVELWRNKANLAEVKNIKYYLYKSVRRKIFKELEKENKNISSDLSDDYKFEVSFSHEYELILNQAATERKGKLIKSFDNLSKRQKEAIFLRFYENLEYHEIASIMALKEVKYARTLIYRSIEVLKLTLVKEEIF